MTSSERVPVVIVGGGPTGIVSAIMLAQRGVRSLVLEHWPDVYPLPRAVHFDDEVFRVLAGLGLEQQLFAISRPVSGMQLVDPSLRVLAEFRRDPSGQVHGYPQSNMFDQPELERVLRARLAELPVAELRSGVEVQAVDQIGGPAPVRVRYRDAASGAEREVWADTVLGCDGANSTVRSAIGAAMIDLGFQQDWLVVDVASPEPLHAYDGVQQICDADRAATFMMVTPGRYRWEFRLRPHELADEIDDAAVLALIRPWLGAVEPDKLTLLRQARYTFSGAVADRWRDRRVFLLGDAAHLTPPFIGQGLCAGIRDAANLTWKLALVLDGRADDRLLATYQDERAPYARRVIQMAIAVGWLMTGGSPRTAPLRRRLLRALTRLPGVETRALNAAWPGFGCGPLSAPKDRAAGHLCPQPRLYAAGREVPLDAALGTGFAIVARGHDGTAAYDPDTRAFYERLGVAFVSLNGCDGALADLLERAGARALLLRPDRVIVASGDRADLRTWRRLLQAAGITLERSP